MRGNIGFAGGVDNRIKCRYCLLERLRRAETCIKRGGKGEGGKGRRGEGEGGRGKGRLGDSET